MSVVSENADVREVRWRSLRSAYRAYESESAIGLGIHRSAIDFGDSSKCDRYFKEILRDRAFPLVQDTPRLKPIR